MARRHSPQDKVEDVFTSDYFAAILVFPPDDEKELATRLARKMRVQNGSRYLGDRNRLAPVAFTSTPEGHELKLMGKAGSMLDIEFSSREDGYVSGPTKRTIGEYLTRLFGVPARVEELPIDSGDDTVNMLIDTFNDRFSGRFNVVTEYPQPSDVLSAGKLEAEGIAFASEFVGTSPYYSFTATSKRLASDFAYDPRDYLAACKAVARNSDERLYVESVHVDAGGRVVVRGYGVHHGGACGSKPAPANETCASPIEYYLDSDIEIELYETSVAHARDLARVDRIADFVASAGVQQRLDFMLVDVAAAEEAHERTMGYPELDASGDSATSDELFDALIGLEDVKVKVRRYVRQLAFKASTDGRMPSPHLLMCGNPGTGKTTVARVIAQALYEEGLVESPTNFVEVSRGDLCGGYMGQTALKTKACIDRARHGMLFIDEAYALDGGPHDSYGREAIATIVKEMEDCLADYERRGFVCVMAGYTGPMEGMLSVNPGLRDRFAHRIDFPDYDADELLEIFYKDVEDRGLSVLPEACPEVERIVRAVYEGRDGNFANARVIRKLVEHLEMLQLDLAYGQTGVGLEVVCALAADDEVVRLTAGPGGGRTALAFT